MRAFAVRATDLAKQYRIGRRQTYRTFREAIRDTVLAPFSRKRADAEEAAVWALDGISFEIDQGEVVGIIGRNGAGKSTLLKILSRITEPTRGQVELRGRVGALLEVGTGFHPELTGRENVYLSGAVLGMKRADIARKFDAIVAFADVEKFLDTQVKHYSTGMFMRLAFAVAAHLEPEVLVVDEVLAVGDASFQRKCLSKMEDVGKEGRTVLFVSHNMPAITRLCPRAILLDQGRILKDGPAHEVASTYLASGLGTTAAREWNDLGTAPGNEIVRLRAVRVRDRDGQVSAAVNIRRPVGIEMEFDVLEGGHRLVPNLHFFNDEGVYAFVSSEIDSPWHRKLRPPGSYVATAWIPGNLLSEGTLIVGAAVSTMDPVTVHFYERDAVAFQVVDSLEGDSARGDYGGPMPGVVRPLLRWETTFVPADSRRADERAKAIR
jgi:lipopolysaccharide transport system ATP-binding protein